METRRRRLLLADDSLTIQKVVSLTLSDEGIEVVTASDGEQALRLLEEDEPPDILLADIFMPPPNGYELCERIKGDSRFQHIPVVLLVGTFEPFNEAEARRVGADDVLTKPFQSIRDLVGRVGSLLGGSGRPAEDEPDTAELSSPRAAANAATAAAPSADARPEPRPWNEPSIRATGSADGVGVEAEGRQQPVAESAAEEVPFVDISMDDQMIEARPVEAFEEDEPMAVAAQEESRPVEQASQSFAVSGSLTGAHENMQMNIPQSFSAQASGASAADDALLDLGYVEPPPSTIEADDFILDLAEESPAPTPQHHAASPTQELSTPTPTAQLERPEDVLSVGNEAGASANRVDASASLAEAAHGERETPRTFEAWDDDEMPTMIAYAPGTSAAPGETALDRDEQPLQSWAGEESAPAEDARQPQAEVFGVGESSAGVGTQELSENLERGAMPTMTQPQAHAPQETTAATPDSRQVGLEQLSPEAIDAIARRAVELLSERVVQDIAWEVVPQLAELLIKRRLEEERAK